MNSCVATSRTSLLGSRYLRNSMGSITLNPLQSKVRDEIQHKIDSKIYHFESLPCCVCAGKDFTPLASEDRCGITTPVVICDKCGLVQTNPRLTENSYQDFYSHAYRQLTHGRELPKESVFESERERGHEQFDWLQKTGLLPAQKKEKLALEIGCGSGGILQHFKDQGWRIKGIDLDEAYVAYGRDQHGLDLSIEHLDQIKDMQADLIILSHALEHLPDPNRDLKRISGLLAENGLLFIEVPGIKNLWPAYLSDFQRYIQCAHTYHFSLTTLTNLLQANQFKLVTGDETVRTVFKRSARDVSPPTFIDDTKSILRYLRIAEIKRVLLSPVITPLIHLVGWLKRRQSATA